MIDDYSRDLLRTGIIELKSGNRDTARRYLDRALYMSSDHDVMAEAWYWMSQLDDDPAQKRRDIENCLAHDLRHARARRVLAILDGRLKPSEIVDRDTARPPEPPNLEDTGQLRLSTVGARISRLPTQAEARRFMCPKCGGRMTYSPDGGSLVCEYCKRNETLNGARPSASQKDFLVTMATARGSGKPLAEQAFTCQGCGAAFILAPGRLSITCPYCGSPHVVSFAKSPDLLAPDGIIPHAFDAAKASGFLTDWWMSLSKGKERAEISLPGSPRPLYLPLWTFDVGGVIDYTAEVLQEQNVGLGRSAPRLARVNDVYPVQLMRLPIPAGKKLSAPFVRLLPTFDLKAVQPYDPRFLADWPAELYDIPMADASLDARSQAFALTKKDMELRIAPMRMVSASSARLDIESFQLHLVPAWISEVEAGGRSHLVLINGQTGDIWSDVAKQDKPKGSIVDWLGELV